MIIGERRTTSTMDRKVRINTMDRTVRTYREVERKTIEIANLPDKA